MVGHAQCRSADSPLRLHLFSTSRTLQWPFCWSISLYPINLRIVSVADRRPRSKAISQAISQAVVVDYGSPGSVAQRGEAGLRRAVKTTCDPIACSALPGEYSAARLTREGCRARCIVLENECRLLRAAMLLPGWCVGGALPPEGDLEGGVKAWLATADLGARALLPGSSTAISLCNLQQHAKRNGTSLGHTARGINSQNPGFCESA